jgi:hypothetical protein
MKIGINTLVSAVFLFYSYKKKAEMSRELQRYFTPAQILVLGGGFPNVGGTIEGYVIPFRISLSGGGSLILPGIASLTTAMAMGLGVPLSC